MYDLSKNHLKNLKYYKPQFIISSPFNLFLTVPALNFLHQKNYLPEKYAPNFYTLVSFFFTIVQYILLTIYDPTFNAQSSARIRYLQNLENQGNQNFNNPNTENHVNSERLSLRTSSSLNNDYHLENIHELLGLGWIFTENLLLTMFFKG